MLHLIGTYGRASCKRTSFFAMLTVTLLAIIVYCALDIGRAAVHREYKKEINIVGMVSLWEEEQPIFANLTIESNGIQLNLVPSEGKLKETFFAEDIILSNLKTTGGNVTGDLVVTLTNHNIVKTWTLSDIVAQAENHSDLSHETCLAENIGCWHNERCVHHYRTTEVCLVINERSLEATDNYPQGCYNKGLETFEVANSTSCLVSADVSHYPVNFRVVSQADPHIQSWRNRLVYYTRLPIRDLGFNITIVSICVLLLFLPAIFFLRSSYKPLLDPTQIY